EPSCAEQGPEQNREVDCEAHSEMMADAIVTLNHDIKATTKAITHVVTSWRTDATRCEQP
ncbi:MAG: hypothetical protein NXI04_23875, partial [Planctomycetaceae bacterium]|nr:hypothetical protein [Planctomycetaceae bacterium]